MQSSDRNQIKGSADSLRKAETVIRSYLQRDDRYYEYNLGDDKLQELNRVIDICRVNDIQLEIIIPPIHATQLEAIYQAGLWEVFLDWKREVSAMSPVWDFSGYSDVTQEPLGGDMRNYDDPSHFSYVVAEMMLKEIFGSGDYIGVKLTADNVDSYNQKLTEDRRTWIQVRPRDYRFVKEIAEEL